MYGYARWKWEDIVSRAISTKYSTEYMYVSLLVYWILLQAPASMKSVLQAAWLLTVSFGNLIVVIIAEAKFFERQVSYISLFIIYHKQIVLAE